jgi:hypothetical protein
MGQRLYFTYMDGLLFTTQSINRHAYSGQAAFPATACAPVARPDVSV